jgi:hypothetical protein
VDKAIGQAAAPKSGVAPKQRQAPQVIRDFSKLPAPVARMREAILDAVKRGDIAELRYAIELNELPPDFGNLAGDDVIDGLRKSSADGQGVATLALLAELLELPCAVIPVGPDVENAKLYVWPYLAEMPLSGLSPPQKVDLYRLVDHGQAREMLATGVWKWWRLAIGADGVWHVFSRGDR